MNKIMITLNGNKKVLDAKTLSIQKLLEQENIDPKEVAIALNRVFLPKQQYTKDLLKENDEIEIVVPFQGG